MCFENFPSCSTASPDAKNVINVLAIKDEGIVEGWENENSLMKGIVQGSKHDNGAGTHGSSVSLLPKCVSKLKEIFGHDCVQDSEEHVTWKIGKNLVGKVFKPGLEHFFGMGQMDVGIHTHSICSEEPCMWWEGWSFDKSSRRVKESFR